MRKILTNWVCILEDENYTTLGWFEKSQGFVEKRSKIIFTRRCEIFTNPWLFLIISPLFFMKSPHFFGGKPWKILGFCWKVWKNLFFNPARIAYFRPTDLVVENKRKIPPEKCEKFWQNFHQWHTFIGTANAQTIEIALQNIRNSRKNHLRY